MKKKHNKKMSKGLRRHIRKEKARIRREVLEKEKQDKEIKKILEKYKKRF